MALTVTNIDELNVEHVVALQKVFTQLIQEKHPNIDVSRGVFHDLVLYFSSVLHVSVQENISRVMRSGSLLDIVADPTLADPLLVDKVLSNYNVTRGDSAYATGSVVVIANQNLITSVSNGITLTAAGALFRPTMTFTGVPAGQPITAAGERELLAIGNDLYAFTIDVIAVELGGYSNIKQGTKLIPNAPPANVNDMYAAIDFVSGVNEPTNAEYLTKLSNGLVAKTIGGRKAFVAAIKAQPAFSATRHISVVGYGDAEQNRDQHTLFPVSGGGRVDLYVQTSPTAQVKNVIVQATYIRPADALDILLGSVWQLSLSRNDMPGFYALNKITNVVDTADGGYAVLSQNRGYNFADIEYAPDIKTLDESEYTRYKTVVCQFVDTDELPTVALIPGQSKKYYSVALSGMPNIGEIQDFLSSPDIRCQLADVVVKAAVPCFVAIDFKILKTANNPDPDFAAIRQAIVTAIASVGFAGQLHASTISGAVQPYLSHGQAISRIDMFGKIIRPDGETKYVRDYSVLVIPNDPARMTSPKTVVFLTTVDAISIGSEVIVGFNA